MGTAMREAEATEAMSPADLCRRCREETARYRRRESHDDQFCFQVIWRAVTRRDQDCWEGLVGVYGEQVAAWCRRAGGDPAEVEELAALAWAKFWQHYTAEKLASANGTAAVLRYLQVCAQSAVLDAARARGRRAPVERQRSSSERAAPDAEMLVNRYPDPAPTPEEVVTAQAASAEVWQAVDALLRTERERVLVYLTYELGLRSAEIQARRPDLFPSVKEVYSATRALHERLGRSSALRRWLEEARQ